MVAADQDLGGLPRVAGNPEVAGQQIAGPHGDDAEGHRFASEHLDDLEDRSVPTHRHDDIGACLHCALRPPTQVALAVDQAGLYVPTRRLEAHPGLAHGVSHPPTLSASSDDQRPCHLAAAVPRPTRFLASRTALPQFHQLGRARNAAPTTSSQAIPARMPPTTSVR